MTEPIVDLLATEWQALADLADGFDDTDWDTATELPGWTVKDCYAHIVGTERQVRGEPVPEFDATGLTHLTAPSSMFTEPAVAARRGLSGAEVLAEFRQVTGERVGELRALPPEKWDEIGPTPLGDSSYRAFMDIRLFDCWMHEQDVRRALDRPGHQDGPIAEHALGRCAKALGFVVGKKAGAPDGSTVVFEVTGPLARTLAVAVLDGRARLVDSAPVDGAPGEPTVRLTLDQEALWSLGGGRWDPDTALAESRVSVEGDQELGERVIRSLNFLI